MVDIQYVKRPGCGRDLKIKPGVRQCMYCGSRRLIVGPSRDDDAPLGLVPIQTLCAVCDRPIRSKPKPIGGRVACSICGCPHAVLADPRVVRAGPPEAPQAVDDRKSTQNTV